MKRISLMLLTIFSLCMVLGCTAREITIEFVENGGTDIEELSIAQSSTINEIAIEREGYTFTGWYEDESLTTSFNFENEIVRNMTLYAGWSINTYTVTFVLDNGSDNITVTGEYNTALSYPENPTKTGHSFDAWYGEVELENELNLNRIPSENTTVYAGYNANEYTVNFYYEDGEEPIYTEVVKYGEGVKSVPALPVTTGYTNVWDKDVETITEDLDVYVESTILEFDITFKSADGDSYLVQTYQYGEKILPDTTPSKEGYDFLGYYAESLGVNVDLSTYTVSEDLVLQDVFQIQTFNVLFYGGENNSLLGEQQIIDWGTSALAPTEGLDKLGYTFTGWDVAYDVVTEDLTVTALYTINQYTVTFVTNDGTNVSPITEDYNTLVNKPVDPTKQDNIFIGWFEDEALTQEFNFGPGIPMPVDGLTLYAKWFDLTDTTYTVSGTSYFGQFGISTDELSVDDVYVTNNHSSYTPFTDVVYNSNISPVRDIEGYVFYKYVVDGVEYFDETRLVTITEDTVVDVYYEKVIQSVTFNETINGTPTTSVYYVYYNTSLINVPTVTPKTGYTVTWDIQDFNSIKSDVTVQAQYDVNSYTLEYLDWDHSVLYTNSFDFDEDLSSVSVLATRSGYTFTGWDIEKPATMPANNLTIRAEYTINQYTITFVTNGGTQVLPITEDYNTLVNKPVDPTKQNHTFVGWFEDEALTQEFNFGPGIPMPADGLTLYAKWIDLAGTAYTVSGTSYFGQFGISTDELSVDNVYVINSHNAYTPFIDVVYNSNMSPVRDIEGYVFYKYVVDGIEYFDETRLVTITEDTVIDVYYKKAIQSVTFNETINGTPTTSVYYVYYNTSLTNIPTATPKTGYTVTWDIQDFNSIKSDVTVQAQYDVNSYTLEYLDWDHSVLYTNSFDFDEDLSSVSVLATRSGYTFTGWDIEKPATMPANNLTIKAEYTINQYTIAFVANGGTQVLPITKDYNSTVNAPEDPTKDGFEFIGWYEDEDLTQAFSFGPGIPMPVDGFTLYAKWSELIGQTFTVSGTYYYEQADISVDELSLLGTYTSTGSETYTPFYNVYYNTNMSAVRDIEGYTFYKYVVDGVEYFDASELINIKADKTVDVYYRRIVLEITFKEFVSGQEQSVTYYVHYNDSLTNAPSPTAISGVTVEWDNQNFTNLKENLNVLAIQYDNTYETVIFMSNGTIMYIGINDTGNPNSVVIAQDSPLWNLEIEGSVFLGWYIKGTETQVPAGDILFTFTNNITTLEARWLELVVLEEPTNIVMDVDGSTKTITIDFTVAPSVINSLNVYPNDFTFILNGSFIKSSDIANDLLMNYITSNGDAFTLTLETTNPYYDLFKELIFSSDDNYSSLIVGTHLLQIVSLGNDTTSTDSEPSYAHHFTVDSIYDGIPESVTTSDYYLIEDFGNSNLRYIFYSNLTYQFNGKEFDILQGSNVITANGNILNTTSNTGEFIFTITDSEGTRTYNGLVVEDIRQFDIGSSYQNYLNEVNVDLEDDHFLNEATTFDYLVGASNDFYLDLLLSDNNGSKIDLGDALLDYKFYLDGSATALTEVELETYLTLTGNVIDFKNTAVGHAFKILVEPKYESRLMDMEALEFNLHVNDGYNAFTNTELKTLYKDMNVSLINIHRDIVASLDENQLHEDGTPINYFAHTTDFEDIGNVYYRINGSTDDDSVIIEGNFMTIDGSDIEKINADNPGFGTIDYADLFDIISTQIGIFYYNVSSTTPINNNTFTMNNLRIIGNTTTPSVNYDGSEEEILYEESLMEQNSGGMLGVVVRAGEANLNNLVIGYTVIAVTTNAWGENSLGDELVAKLDYVQIYDSWANSVFSHGSSGVSLDHSNIGTSGGAAIHFEDTRSGSGGYLDPQLYISSTTEVNNWISGSEAWFKAYGMGAVALALKSGIDTGISDLGKTIIQTMENPVTGLDTEMMNFVFLSLPNSGAHTVDSNNTSLTLTASQVVIDVTDIVGHTRLDRTWDFITTDPRTDQNTNQFAFAVGALSETQAFIDMVTEISTIYYGLYSAAMDPADAGQLAYIAGFYNLTAQEALNVAGAMQQYSLDLHGAIAAVKGSLDYPQPQYIEVISALPLTDAGNATILIEMFNDIQE